jgi:hypothetical protein
MRSAVDKAKYETALVRAIVQNIICALAPQHPVSASLTLAKFAGCLVAVRAARRFTVQDADHTPEILRCDVTLHGFACASWVTVGELQTACDVVAHTLQFLEDKLTKSFAHLRINRHASLQNVFLILQNLLVYFNIDSHKKNARLAVTLIGHFVVWGLPKKKIWGAAAPLLNSTSIMKPIYNNLKN